MLRGTLAGMRALGVQSEASLLRPEICPQCAYSLTGLPREGVCPECGADYDSNDIVLFGWGRGQHSTPVNCTPKALVAWTIAFVGLLAYLAANSVDRLGVNGFYIVGAVALLIYAILVVLKRIGCRFPAPAALLLTPLGCGRDRNSALRRPSATAWRGSLG